MISKLVLLPLVFLRFDDISVAVRPIEFPKSFPPQNGLSRALFLPGELSFVCLFVCFVSWTVYLVSTFLRPLEFLVQLLVEPVVLGEYHGTFSGPCLSPPQPRAPLRVSSSHLV